MDVSNRITADAFTTSLSFGNWFLCLVKFIALIMEARIYRFICQASFLRPICYCLFWNWWFKQSFSFYSVLLSLQWLKFNPKNSIPKWQQKTRSKIKDWLSKEL